LLRLIREKDKLYKISVKKSSTENKLRYQAAKKLVKKKIKMAKIDYERRLTSRIKNNPKLFYQYYGTKEVKSFGPVVDNTGNVILSHSEMCKAFNDYFSSVFVKDDNMTQVKAISTGINADVLSDINISVEVVRAQLNKLNSNKSAGPDNLWPVVIKNCKDVLCDKLHKFFNDSFNTGCIPDEWKQADIIPIFKSGDKRQLNNYRPVSLTSQICKIFERIIAKEMMKFLESKNILTTNQYGFRKNRSGELSLINFYKDVFMAVDKGLQYDVIYLDFSKAFDKVSHKLLIHKLFNVGIRGKLLAWLENWLKNRVQRVKIEGAFSEWISVESGVPQGSVLGPLLFLLYINDIDKDLDVNVAIFADDIKIGCVVRGENDALKLDKNLQNIVRWSKKWKMLLNCEKTKVVRFGRVKTNYLYSVDNVHLSVVSKIKDLGVLIDNKLNFNEHVQEKAKSSFRILGYINRSVINKSKAIVLPLYNSLVRPHVEYAARLWNPCTKTNIKFLERIQRRATKMIKECKGLNYNDRLRSLNLFSLAGRRRRGDLIQTFKLLKNHGSFHENILLSFANNRQTRKHNLALKKWKFRTEVGRREFSNRVVNEWNKLSSTCTSKSKLNSFKNAVDKEINFYFN
jgi:hypothetical protein